MYTRTIWALCLLILINVHASGTSVPVGFISWDVTTPGSTGQFDIANETGPNSSGDATAPVTTALRFTNLQLQITFTDNSTQTFGNASFSPNAFDGLSWESPVIQIGGANPAPKSAVLTGTFGANIVTLVDSSQLAIDANFIATISTSGARLLDGDLAIINAQGTASPIPPNPPNPPSTPAPTVAPEPASMPTCIAGFILLVLSAHVFGSKRRGQCVH